MWSVEFLPRTMVTWLLSAAWILNNSSVLATRSATNEPLPTDFIDCNDPCNGGDVNYELIASIQTMKMGFGNYTYRGRTFARPDPITGQIPTGEHMGPTLTVAPGQSLWIKFRNELYSENDSDKLKPFDVTTFDYWDRLKVPGEKIKYQYYKKPVASPDLMEVDWHNMPKNFDATNLHLHGLDVEVHMFDPVGTHNPEAPHIAIEPGQCYCYRFQLPEDHPDGLYWYHPHLHGSSAVQLWGGMMGLIKVEGNLMTELENYNVRDSRDFVLWDPAFQDIRDEKPNAQHDIEVDEFLLGQTTLSKIHPFLVNGQITPQFHNVTVGQVLHLRALCGTIENENTFIIYKAADNEETVDYATYWKEHAVPFWVVASDGVTYSKPIQRKVIVMAGGQREELLLQFDEPGKYVISQQGIQSMQFFDMPGHPHDQILAEIYVDSSRQEENLPTVPIEKMIFTPGYREDEKIHADMVDRTESIVFSMGANRNMAPFPQYYINGKSFHPDRLDFHANPGEVVEYILINANHNVHPFHIHVNRFQVHWMGSTLSTEKYPALAEVMNYNQDVWRDTVVIPPNGTAVIWVQYKNYTGKTVFHCHFLAHEDTGMMATLFIGPPDVLFHWRDHIPLLVGCAIGLVLGIFLLGAVVVLKDPTKNSDRMGYYYSAIKMNEMKSEVLSKTID